MDSVLFDGCHFTNFRFYIHDGLLGPLGRFKVILCEYFENVE